MPATYSSRPVRRAHRERQQNSTANQNRREPSRSSEEEEDLVIVDIEGVRRARAEFYTSAPEEREAQKNSDSWFRSSLESNKRPASRPSRHIRAKSPRTMTRGSKDKEPDDSKRRSETRSTVTENRHIKQTGTTMRRRKNSNERVESEENDFVYRGAPGKSRSPSPKPRRSSTVSSARRRPNPLPPRVQVLRTLGLKLPQRTSSQKTSPRPAQETEARRHSYSGNVQKSAAPKARRNKTMEVMASRPQPARSVSLRETSKSSTRPPLLRSQTSAKKPRQTSAPLPAVVEGKKSLSASKTERPGSVFGSLFAAKTPTPEVKVTCLTCLSEDIPISRSAKLACKHRMCYACLKRIFTMSVTDPAHMPPKCCTSDHIPLKHVDKLFDTKFKVKWNMKYQEYTTKNRIYCPAKGCGAWIPPRDIHLESQSGRRYGKCTRCRTKVCATCNGKWHTAKECPNDEATLRFAEIAKESGWQRCFNCSAMVELKEGCNHMTCRCTAEFCMICGKKWKSCDCPWFNYATVETDRLNHMNIAQVRREPERAQQPRAYHEELERRREQERRDEELARRMQGLDIDRNTGSGRARRGADNDSEPSGGIGIFAVGNAAAHFMNENFVNRAATILTGVYNPAQQAAANRLVAEIRGSQRATDLAPLDDTAASPAPRLQRSATIGTRRPDMARRVTAVPTGGRGAERTAPVPRRVPSAATRNRPVDDGQVLSEVAQVEAQIEAQVEAQPDAAKLAGLTKRTTAGRVDMWRRQVSGGALG